MTEQRIEHVSVGCSDFTEEALWARWWSQRDAAAREALIEQYLPYAKTVAATYYARRTHDEIEFDEYLQFATVGLVESFDRFERERGAQFKTFASRRMSGAILNGLEQLTEKQQQIAARSRLRQERLDEAKRTAAETESSAGSGQTGRLLKAGPFRYLAEVSIGVALTYLLEGTGLIASEAEPVAEAARYYGSIELRQLQDRLRRQVDALSAQEQLVIRSHYLQEIGFADIAQSLGVTKGRVSQIHRQALEKLRLSLRTHRQSDVAW